MSCLKLFHTTNSGVIEVTTRLADIEGDVLVEAHMETMLDVTFLASEYVIPSSVELVPGFTR